MLAREVVRSDEHEIVEGLIEDNLPTVGTRNGVRRRGQHAKHHAVVDGSFQVLEDLPEIFRTGLFQPGKTYECRVRFSNGGQWDDRRKDVRGMAIKLFDVNGLKLLPAQGHIRAHDFLLVDHPTYFSKTLHEYEIFNRNFTPVQSLRVQGFNLVRLWRALRGILVMLVFHRPQLSRARTFAGRPGTSLAALTYHSAVPYLFGDGRAVKYKLTGGTNTKNPARSKDGLSAELWDQLEEGPLSFEFGIVLQSDSEGHPIEDPTTDWELAGARYVPLARLLLHQQANSEEKRAYAESSHFSPWQCLAEHRPLGAINRVRLRIYQAMLEMRERAGG